MLSAVDFYVWKKTPTAMSKDYTRIEMDLVFGSAKPYGSSRSIVRRIATSLPLKPCPRVHFQLHPYTGDAGFLTDTRQQGFLVASLADITWIEQDGDDEEDFFGRPRLALPEGFVFRACQPRPQKKPFPRQRSLPTLHSEALDLQGSTTANNETIEKISALETELAKLRAQIAQIVLAQEKIAQPASAVGAPPPPLPCGTLHHPPPPPPPPPPLSQQTFSAIDLIKERRGKKTDRQTGLDSTFKSADIPNMLDVLKDLNKVKLRSVKSRLGELDAKPKPSEPPDAAALIAEALKRKFAHQYRRDSEVQDSMQEFKLPLPQTKPQTETPLFGQHLLKPTGKRNVL
ncbi:mitochondrial fission regulator 1 isoform X2 [Thalassophryne amazonica]|uniref:mitochondrial fission regulator 1 isoform X2 n=1 Tax=Thalassophryne amazonica TaxID=390379 RepID=UPI001470C0B9|nr:mitochondrial fission regulator 1 isoform X2 [Thalassophryne amazonica]